MTPLPLPPPAVPLRPARRGPGAWRVLAALGVLALPTAGAAALVHQLLPAPGTLARGLRLEGETLPPGSEARSAVRAALGRRLDARLAFTHEGRVVFEASARELGATDDPEALAVQLEGVGRRGPLARRIDDAYRAYRGATNVKIRLRLPAEPLAAALERWKDEADSRPRNAKFDFAGRGPTPHAPGRLADLQSTAAAAERALAEGRPEVPIAFVAVLPAATTEAVAAIDVHEVVSRYETRFGFVGGQEGRATNVALAASRIDGVVLLPGEIVSFNDHVGARSEENGFRSAPEIYKGEMREGIGGGTCQVSGTLHAAAYFGGFDVVERSNHSRPSGYIGLGLDATVVYPVVDLRLRNPYAFPVVVRAYANAGVLQVELRGRARPATVDYQADTIGVSAFKRKVEEVAYLPEGQYRLKQRGIRGVSIRKTRVVRPAEGEPRVDVTTDVYPPTAEIYLVPKGADAASLLPPPPEEAGAVAAASPSAR